jgi:hypothetical protein
MVEIMKAEDSLVFGTTGNGIRANTTNDIEKGSAATGYASLDFDDMIAMETELDAQYLAGSDIQGSGIIGGAPRYFLPHSLVQELKAKKETGTGAYLDEAKELRNSKSTPAFRQATRLPFSEISHTCGVVTSQGSASRFSIRRRSMTVVHRFSSETRLRPPSALLSSSIAW